MPNIRTAYISVPLFCIFLGSACSTPSQDSSVTVAIPDTVPTIIGQITAIALPMIVVEENPAESYGSAKARMRITPDTQVLRLDKGAASTADLRKGQKVRVWFVGPVMESYPMQGTAGMVVIE